MRAGATWVSELVTRIVCGIKDIGSVALVVGGLGAGAGCQSGEVDAAEAPPRVSVTDIHEIKPVAETGPKVFGKFKMTFYYVIAEDEVRPAVAKPSKPAPGAPVLVAANDNAPAAIAGAISGAISGAADRDGSDPATAEHDGSDPDTASAADVELAAMALAPNDLVPVYSSTCEAIADVASPFLEQLRVQGTGRLRDGRVLTVWGPCDCARSPCFSVTEHQWGRSGNGRALLPFRTVAVDPRVVKLGTLLFIPELEGRTMPGRAPWGGFVHDGCVVADDTGGSIKNTQLDLFVGRKGWYNGLSEKGRHSWARGVTVIDGTKKCERKGRSVTRRAGAI